MELNLGHLAVFHAVAEEKSISRGAERLLVSQPAVSKQVRLLEESVAAPLFERLARGIRLTETGEVLAGYARRIFALKAEAIRALEDLRGLQRGRLAIGASTTIGVYLLPEIFVQFRRKYPAIETTLEVASSRGVQERLAEGALDVGFMETPPVGDGWESGVLMRDGLVGIASPNHPLAGKARVTAAAFCREPFIVRATGSDTKSFVECELAERGLTVKPVMSLGTTEAIKRAVAAGIGVAIVSHLSIGMELKAGTLAVVRMAGMSIRRPLYKVTRRGTSQARAMGAFMELLEAAIKNCA